jgi:hypothetical protein
VEVMLKEKWVRNVGYVEGEEGTGMLEMVR